jgi:hypothetical protein
VSFVGSTYKGKGGGTSMGGCSGGCLTVTHARSLKRRTSSRSILEELKAKKRLEKTLILEAWRAKRKKKDKMKLLHVYIKTAMARTQTSGVFTVDYQKSEEPPVREEEIIVPGSRS